VGLIFLVFFIHGAWPAPLVNETHYLAKARHYWDPSWCAGDFFCGTADAHQVFYWSFGWLSRVMPLPAMAWCGRLLTWGLLAWAWRRLSAALVPAALYAVLSAALFVTLNDRCQMAGEWVVGGVEAKGFAYVLVLLGLEALVRGLWGRAWLLFGAASSFHVIIGGWAVVAAVVVWLTDPLRPPLRTIVLPLAGGLLLALPGLLPAVALTWHVEEAVVREANRIYVFERLYHHLLPQSFPPLAVMRHLLLVAVLVVLLRLFPRDSRWQRLHTFVAVAVGLAAVGMAIALVTPLDPDLSAGLLRYYWFRMSDVMVPLGVALVGVSLMATWRATQPGWQAVAMVVALLLAGGDLGHTTWWRQQHLRPPADANIGNLDAWRQMCAWAAAETPPEAVFLVPRLSQTFRWYAGRGEVVSRKDLPQDAEGIVEWWRRLNRIYRAPGDSSSEWHENLAELGTTRLRQLGAEFGADYVITAAYPALNLPRVGPSNPSFAIYRLTPPAADRPTDAPRTATPRATITPGAQIP